MSEPKASVDDLKDEGFTASQFGSPTDFDTAATGYLAKVLKSAGLWVEQKLGAPTYAALVDSTYAWDCARQAEVGYASAELYRRRYTFVESNASSALAKDQAMVLTELRRRAAEALDNAKYWLGEAMRASGVDDSALYDGSGLATGVVETGRYASVLGSAG
ncbi:hypothetical protein [Dyella sp.]|uniref:hypothetical protein n=1 Tax=Dyella sp. TaxID=1869338 RepID=UPI003F808A53